MNQTELKKKLARESGISQRKAGEIIRTLTGIISSELISGNDVTLKNFGCFHTVRYSRDNVTTPWGDVLEIKPHRVVRFRPAKALKKEIMSAGEDESPPSSASV